MKDITLLFNMISLFTGVASISISIFILKTYRKRTLKFFIGLNISLFLIQNAITLTTYAIRVGRPDAFVAFLSKILDAGGTACSTFFGLFFIYYLLAKEISNFKRWIIILVSIAQFVIIIANSIVNASLLRYAAQLSLVLVMIYEALLIARSYQQIGNRDLKKAIHIFVTVSILFVPLFLFEYVRPMIPFLKHVVFLKVLSLPLYFLTINLLSLTFANRYFNSPNFLENNQLTNYFIEKYSITDQETKVIEQLLAGLTYKQIAENLFIANKTVDNHIQNIYKKLEVGSKIQLFNLVHSKEK